MTTQKICFELKRLDLEGDYFTGLAAVYGNTDRHGDILEPGAFDNTLSRLVSTDSALPLLWNHNTNEPVGVVERLTEAADGLRVRAKLFSELRNAKTARDLISGGAGFLSIGYITKEFEDGGDGRRHLVDVDLLEVSVVATPSNPLAMIDRKSVTKAIQDEGLSARQARKFVHAGLAAIQDADPNQITAEEAVLELRSIAATNFKF